MNERKSVTLNQRAFLDLIAWSEGTSRVAGSDDGYNVIVGGTLFHGYGDHPRKRVRLDSKRFSTAAGRYRIRARYWDAYRRELNLPDFSPASQDAVALHVISECHALQDVEAGYIVEAVRKCARVWASFSGVGFETRPKSFTTLIGKFEEFREPTSSYEESGGDGVQATGR